MRLQKPRQEIENPETKKARRDFLKKTALGGISLAGMMGLVNSETLSQ